MDSLVRAGKRNFLCLDMKKALTSVLRNPGIEVTHTLACLSTER